MNHLHHQLIVTHHVKNVLVIPLVMLLHIKHIVNQYRNVNYNMDNVKNPMKNIHQNIDAYPKNDYIKSRNILLNSNLNHINTIVRMKVKRSVTINHLNHRAIKIVDIEKLNRNIVNIFHAQKDLQKIVHLKSVLWDHHLFVKLYYLGVLFMRNVKNLKSHIIMMTIVHMKIRNILYQFYINMINILHNIRELLVIRLRVH